MYLLLVKTGDKYSQDYVRVLQKQAKQVLDLDTYVLGDVDADIYLDYDWPGWWAKMEMFRPDIPKPFLYVDLDSFILGDVSDLFEEEGRWIAREWHPNIQGCGKVQSSMIYMNEEPGDIWSEWIMDPNGWMQRYRGDQKYLERFEWNIIQDKYEHFVGSYKMHNLEEPKDAVVTFHGRPKQPVAEGWAKDLWESSLI